MKRLDGKVAVVVGGSRGIGETTARQLADLGSSVVIAAQDLEACRRIAYEINEAGQKAEPIRCDVADYHQVERLVDHALRRFDRLDCLVCSAAVIEPIGYIENYEPEEFARAVGVNLFGVFHCLKAALPVFRHAREGIFVNVSTGAVDVYIEGWAAYCATKTGASVLAKAAASEVSGSSIRIYSFQPGIVDTSMQATIRASGINSLSRRPREELSPPSEPAKVIAWLCAEAPEDLAGQEFEIDDPTLRRRAGLAV